MTPEQYNAERVSSGALTMQHLTELVKAWQAARGLEVDGMAGPKTIQSIADRIAVLTQAIRFLHSPLPVLADGRKAEVTSSFRPTDRLNHNGLDFFYRWRMDDEPHFVGDHGCAGWTILDGLNVPKWGIPYGTFALAAADGVVQLAGGSPTGFRVWVDHGNGWRTGYFHLLDVRVTVGQKVAVGDKLGLVGDNPADHDGRHLHFELSPVNVYAPVNPAPFLI